MVPFVPFTQRSSLTSETCHMKRSRGKQGDKTAHVHMGSYECLTGLWGREGERGGAED